MAGGGPQHRFSIRSWMWSIDGRFGDDAKGWTTLAPRGLWPQAKQDANTEAAEEVPQSVAFSSPFSPRALCDLCVGVISPSPVRIS